MKFPGLFQNRKDVVEFDTQTVIFTAGAPAELLYFIISGKIELSLYGETLSTEGVGGIIGEMANRLRTVDKFISTQLEPIK
jgi:CRP-like cAMP-binding protein